MTLAYLGGNKFYINGRIVRENPYFYLIGKEEPFRESNNVLSIELVDLVPYVFSGVGFKAASGYRVYRVVVDKAENVPKVRDSYLQKGFIASQSIIPFVNRVAIDKFFTSDLLTEAGIKAAIEGAINRKPRLMALDIEVIGGKVLYGYTLDVDNDITVTTNLGDVVAAAADADYVITYNGWNFDINYLGNYVAGLSLDVGNKYVPILDLYPLATGGFKSSLGIVESGASLVDVAIQLGIHKKLNISETILLEVKKRRALIEKLSVGDASVYNATDVLLTYMIGKTWVQVLEVLAALTGTSVHGINIMARGYSPGNLVETVIHKFLELNGIIVGERQKEFEYEAGDKARAGKPGVYTNVGEYDFSAMYPSTMIEFNVDPINIREDNNGYRVVLKKPGGGAREVRIVFEPGGLFNTVFRAYFNARQVTKKLKDAGIEAPDIGVKILVNSMYGNFGKTYGLVNEVIAAFIAQITSLIQDMLWRRFKPIYSDTDSLYIPLPSKDDARKVEDEVNAAIASLGREVRIDHRDFTYYKVKTEDVWDYVVLLPDEDNSGEALEKNYIKVRGSDVVIKGAAIKPRGLPRGLRYGPYREWVRKMITEKASIKELAREFVTKAPIEDLFIEQTMTYEEFFRKKIDGEPISRIDHHRYPIAARLAVDYGRVVLDPINMAVNGVKVNEGDFITVWYLPIVDNGKNQLYIMYVDDAPYFVRVSIRGFVVTLDGVNKASESKIREVAYQVITEHNLFKYLSRVVKP